MSEGLRLLIAPAFNGDSAEHDDQVHAGMRWVRENGHPGACSPDHLHGTPESALACFRGEGR